MRERSRITRNLSRISPSALFQYAAEGLADSGPGRQERFMEDVRTYSRIYDNYIKSKVGKVVATSFWSFSTSMELKGEYINLSSPRPEEYTGDKSDFPYFTESKPSIARNISEAILDLGGLLFWCLITAILAFFAFLRCDVR